MWRSGHFEVVSEPFLELYKRSLLSEEDHRAVKLEITSICETLLDRSQTRKIFVKDMGYHGEAFISDEFIRSINNVFLIRNPELSIPSLFRMRNDYGENETGFEGQLRLFKRTQKLTGNTPLVIDGEALKMHSDSIVRSFFDYIDEVMPPGILRWSKGAREAWVERESWHIDAIRSEGFERIQSEINLDNFPSKVKTSIDRDAKFYEEMFQYVEQK